MNISQGSEIQVIYILDNAVLAWGLAAGISMVIAGATISYWLFGRSLKPKTLAKLGWFVPWILGFYLVLKFGELIIANELHLPFEGGLYTFLFWAELIVGAVIPIILFAFKQVRYSRAGALFASLLVIAGVVLNRFDVTWFAMRPVDGQTYSPHWMEVAILVGVVAGIITVYSLVARYFPIYEETELYRPERPVNELSRLERAACKW